MKHRALAYQQQVTECLELAERCMHRYPIKRPAIQDVICELKEMDRVAASHINGANNSIFEQVVSLYVLALTSGRSLFVASQL